MDDLVGSSLGGGQLVWGLSEFLPMGDHMGSSLERGRLVGILLGFLPTFGGLGALVVKLVRAAAVCALPPEETTSPGVFVCGWE